MQLEEQRIYEIVGDEGFTRLVAAFYRRVPEDPLLGPMYPQQDWAGAEWRLRQFLIQRFGGPDTYTQQRGHPRLRMRHVPFPIDIPARDRWVQLMGEALDEAAFAPEVDAMLRQFFEYVATFLLNR